MGMTIEGEGQTEQLRRNYDRSRPHSSLVYTPRAMGLLKGARYLLLDDDLTQAAYIKIKNETEGMLASGYSPEFDDTLETGKLLRDFGNLLWGTSVAHLNWLLRTMLNVVYVYPWWKEVIGLAQKGAFYEPIQAMAGWDRGGRVQRLKREFRKEWWRRGRVELPVQKSL